MGSFVVNVQFEAMPLNILTGETDVTLVATVSESSNCDAGYTVTMYSANGGKLKNSVDPAKHSHYFIAYNNGTATTPPLAGAPLTVKAVTALTGLTTATSNVGIKLTANPNAVAGTYADTITFCIVAN